jgi:hypothetical protein
MEHLTEDCTEKLNCLQLVERKRNTLEKEKHEAENYLVCLQNDYVHAQSTLCQFYIWHCLVHEKEVKQEIVGDLHCVYSYTIARTQPWSTPFMLLWHCSSTQVSMFYLCSLPLHLLP